MEPYRYECATPAGFVQRVVVLAQCGYRFFVQGEVPERKAVERVDDKILSMYARGMSVRDISAHLHEIYNVEVSPDLISRVTDAVGPRERGLDERPVVGA